MNIWDTAQGVLTNICPKCRDGKVFRSLVAMHPDCPNCGHHFEREPGYFLGAMSLSYVLGFVATLPVFLILLFQDLPLPYIVGIPGIEIICLSPFLLRLSRLVWLHVDFKVTPKATLD